MSVLQDIHIGDKNLYDDFKNYWQQGSYGAAMTVLSNNTQLNNKYVNAAWFNNITDILYALETNPVDTSFKSNKIQVLDTPPTSVSTGYIYFALD